MNGFVSRAEDLEVFRRACRLSLEVHRARLEFPRIEQWALADQVRRASKSICANLAEGFGRAAAIKARVPPLSDDGVRFCGRDAGVDRVLPRSRLYRSRYGRAPAERVPGSCPDAVRPSSRRF